MDKQDMGCGPDKPHCEHCVCNLCDRPFIYSREARTTKTVCRTCLINRHRFKLKAWMVAYKGGCCQLCGYQGAMRALDFHHVDPEEKDFSFGGKHNLGWDRLVEELNKCVCLCRNCHGEVEEALDLLEWSRRLPALDQINNLHQQWKPPTDFPTFTRTGWEAYHPKFGAPALSESLTNCR